MHIEIINSDCPVATMQQKCATSKPIRHVVFLLNVCASMWGCSPDEDSRLSQPVMREVDAIHPSPANNPPGGPIDNVLVVDELPPKSVNATAKDLMTKDTASEPGQGVVIDVVPFELAPGQESSEMVLERNVAFNFGNSNRHNACLKYKNHRTLTPCVLSGRLARKFGEMLDTIAMLLDSQFLLASRPYGVFLYGELVFECHYGLLVNFNSDGRCYAWDSDDFVKELYTVLSEFSGERDNTLVGKAIEGLE